VKSVTNAELQFAICMLAPCQRVLKPRVRMSERGSGGMHWHDVGAEWTLGLDAERDRRHGLLASRGFFCKERSLEISVHKIAITNVPFHYCSARR
jgi:hypothetical protein